jgi:hypothetical protein
MMSDVAAVQADADAAQADADAAQATADGKVSKAGDTMTGPLVVGSDTNPEVFKVRYQGHTVAFAARNRPDGHPVGAIVKNTPAYDYAELIVAEPSQSNHAATKQYADNVFPSAGKSLPANVDLNTVKSAGFYYGYQYTNGPVASGNIMSFIVSPYSGDWGTQIALQPLAAGTKAWIRSWTGAGGTTWSAWKVMVA